MAIFEHNQANKKIIQQIFLERRYWLQDAECLASFDITCKSIMVLAYVQVYGGNWWEDHNLYRFWPNKGTMKLYRRGDEFAVFVDERPICLDTLLSMISFPRYVCYSDETIFNTTRMAEVLMVYETLCKIRNPEAYNLVKKPWYKRKFQLFKKAHKPRKHLIICPD